MLKRLSLPQEILLMLVIKLTLLYTIWLLFFSHPIDTKLTAPDLSTHLFNSPQIIHIPLKDQNHG
jgi:hypothetical protein